MEIPKELKAKFGGQDKSSVKKSRYLHSADHVLADELSTKFGEPKRFGFYLRIAKKYNHNSLRRIAGNVLESKARKPGALFAFLIKKENKNDSADKKSNE